MAQTTQMQKKDFRKKTQGNLLDQFKPKVILGVTGDLGSTEIPVNSEKNVFANQVESPSISEPLTPFQQNQIQKFIINKNPEPQIQKIIKEEVIVKTRFTIKFDPIFLALIIVFFISFDMLLGLVNIGTENDILLTAISISLSGIMGIAVFATLTNVLHMKVKYESFKDSILPIIMDQAWLGVIVIANLIAGKLVPASRIMYDALDYGVVFSIVNAFSEECVFSFFLCSVFFALSKNRTQIILSVVLVAVIFTVYHIFVYDWPQLIVIFVLRIVFNLVYLKSHRLSSVIIIHVINNLIAVLPLILAWGA